MGSFSQLKSSPVPAKRLTLGASTARQLHPSRVSEVNTRAASPFHVRAMSANYSYFQLCIIQLPPRVTADSVDPLSNYWSCATGLYRNQWTLVSRRISSAQPAFRSRPSKARCVRLRRVLSNHNVTFTSAGAGSNTQMAAWNCSEWSLKSHRGHAFFSCFLFFALLFFLVEPQMSQIDTFRSVR